VHLIIVGGNNSIISATWYIFSFYSKENEGEIIVDKVFIGSKLLSNGEKIKIRNWSPCPFLHLIRVQLVIQELSTFKLMLRTHTTSNWGVLELVAGIIFPMGPVPN
jgi:hypothetical protein